MSFSVPAPDFDDPLGLLAACHGRIRERCATLVRLPAHLTARGADAAARTAAARILTYFETAAPHHHADEERDLFPLLRGRARDGGRDEIVRLIDGLAAEHAELDRAWCALRPRLEALRDGDPTPLTDASAVEPLIRLYERHMVREEEGVFAYARVVLGDPERRVLGQAMARRRGCAQES